MPDLILGPSLETRFYESPHGGLLVDVGNGELLDFRRDSRTGKYHLHHDMLVRLAAEGKITEPVRRVKGDFVSFRTGPLRWTVVGWDVRTDVYLCEPG